MQLTLHKGGTLSRCRWVTNLREYVEDDVTESGVRFLYDYCNLEEGVTLRDIFLFIQRHTALLNVVLNKYCAELVADGLSGVVDETQEKTTPYGDEFLELYWTLEVDTACNALEGYHFPQFHVRGVLLEDTDERGVKGDKVVLALGGSRPCELIDLEVRLRPELLLFDTQAGEESRRQYDRASYTLGHILYGIIYEFAYYYAWRMEVQG